MKSSRSVTGLVMIVLLLVLLGNTLSFAQDRSVGKVIHIRGRVEVFPAQGKTWQRVAHGFPLHAGDRVRTGTSGWAAILLADETKLQLNRNTAFTLKAVSSSAAWRIIRKVTSIDRVIPKSDYQLERGEVWLRNKNRQQSINIHLNAMAIGIRGTEINLRVDADETATMTVLEGLAQAQNEFGMLDVAMREQVIARPHAPLVKTVLLTPEDAVQWTIPLPPLFDERNVSPAVQQAFLILQTGEIKRTQQLLDEILRFNAGESSAWSLYALTHLMLGDKKGALEAARRAVATAPQSAMALLIESYAFQAAFDLEQALDATRKALVIDGDYVPALANLARLRFGMDDIEEARHAIDRAGSLAPGNGDVQNLRGFILLAQRKTKEAIAAFQRASTLDPSLGEPHMGIGISSMRQGDIATAMEEITTATLLEPRRSLFLSYWGKMLYQIERFDKALDVLKLAADLDPRDPTPEFYRAVIFRDLNRPTDAIAAINRAVTLNDNRAVYRSRFLLDSDLASKNIDLSLLYNQLGLTAWARNKAMASVKQDYNNASGHLFLSGALRDSDDRSWSFAGESLLARMLQPANVNTFNTFNEYTAFFEKPAINGTVSGTIGENNTGSGEIILDGAVPDMNLALAAGGVYQETDGWRNTNGERVGNFAAYGKWDPTMKDGLMAVFSTQQSKQRDGSYPRYDWDAPRDPNFWTDSNLTRIELGYHHHFSPRSDLLLHYTHMSFKSNNSLTNFMRDLPGPPPMTIMGNSLFSGWNETPYDQLQGQYLFKAGSHQLILGSVQYWGENNISGASSTDVYKIKALGTVFDVSINLDKRQMQNDTGRRSQSYYLQDSWKISRTLSVEGALYFDQMDNGDPVYNTTWTLNEWNPRIGFILTPTDRDTFRLAAFRYLLPYITSRIDPMDIGGVPVLRNNSQGAVMQEYDLSWEREWKSGFLSFGGFYLEKVYTHKIIDAASVTVEQNDHGRMRGVELTLNQLLWRGMGLAASYRYQDVDDDNLPEANREDHLVVAGLKYVHALGVAASIAETYRHERFKSVSRNDEDVWLTDAKVGYEFPKKKGSINLECRNIFNQHFNWVTDYFVFKGRAPVRETLLTLTLNF